MTVDRFNILIQFVCRYTTVLNIKQRQFQTINTQIICTFLIKFRLFRTKFFVLARMVDPEIPVDIVVPVKRRKTKKNPTDPIPIELAEYFERDGDGIKCSIVDCGVNLSRWTLFYLKRHLKCKHRSKYNIIYRAEVESEVQSLVDVFETVQSAVSLVSIHAYPFSLLDKPPFRYMIKPGLDKLACSGRAITLNRHNIVDEISNTSQQIRYVIKQELGTELFSVMFDITTKTTLSVLGVSVSFMRENAVIVRSLGAIKLTKRHTGENVAALVGEILESFGVSFKQIFAITTDNGSNMIKTTRMINEILGEHEENLLDDDEIESDTDDDAGLNTNDNAEDIGTEDGGDGSSSDGNGANGQNGHANDREERFRNIVSEMACNITIQNDYVSSIPAIRCCAHTLQLAIHDAINASKSNKLLNKVRDMCKALRSQVVNIEFRRLSPNTVLPPQDNTTRWCSQYVMVGSFNVYACACMRVCFGLTSTNLLFLFWMLFKQARDFLKIKPTIEALAENAEFGCQFRVAAHSWEKLAEITAILQVPFIVTKEMQRVGYGLSDFYISWLRMKRSLERGDGGLHSLSQCLLNAMKDRDNMVVDTPTMTMAMYLDPRIKYRLSNMQRECAIISLERLHDRMNGVDSANTNENDTLDELNAEALHNNSIDNLNIVETFQDAINKYDAIKPVNIKNNVMDFWVEKNGQFPILYDLARVVHAVPAGQCCVERSFSSFQYIKDSRRNKLSSDNIANVLMIKLNPEVYESWKAGQIAQICRLKM